MLSGKKNFMRLAISITLIILILNFVLTQVRNSIYLRTYRQNIGEKLRTVLRRNVHFHQDKLTNLNETTGGKKVKIILLYTTFFKGSWYLRWNNDFYCSYKSKCLFTYNRDYIHEADAVGFHDADIPGISMPTRTNTKQIWFYFNLESPTFSKINGECDGLFNWTMSYRTDSDVFTPYGSFRPIDCDESKAPWPNTAEKTKLAAWIVSSCNAPSGRTGVARKLSQYIPIDVFGKCGNLTCSKGQELRLSKECRATLQQYKFYLAFENTNCDDYITEKYWEHGLENGLVPIVLGGANYNRLAIPGSYINVRDFKTVKDLAEYIKYLDANRTAYNEYFKWKHSYKLETPYLYGCSLCEALHRTKALTTKVYKDLNTFWRKGKCQEKIVYQ